MLKEIYSEQLITKNRPDGIIKFHTGLNVVLGSKVGTTSIGKSTTLLLIDYAFGGNTYAGSNAVKELGNHTIYFTFSFNGNDYRFARSTEVPGDIALLDKDKNILKVDNKDNFISWLASNYGMDLPGLKFRNTISRFFRIYGKSNYSETRPLQTRSGTESQKDALDVLISLFNKHEEIRAFKEQEKLAEEKISAYRAARKFEFVPSSVDGMKKYQANIDEIAVLQRDRASLDLSHNEEVNKEEIDKANQANSLRVMFSDARRALRQKENDLHLIDLNISQGIYPTEADLKSLSEFFPDVNLKKLMDIEKFHNKIQTILKDELSEAKSKAEEEIKPLQELVESIQKQIEVIKPSMAFSQEFLSAYTQIDRRIHKLEDENEAFATKSRLDREKAQASERLKEHTRIILHEIQHSINTLLIEISRYVSNGLDNPPDLAIKEYNSYNFETPHDTGTGTNYKGMLYYDLSILRLTPLPAMAHDSLLFPFISDEHICKLLQLYAAEKEKQIFIAFDHEENYGTETNNLLRKHMVLKLDAGEKALYGRQWGRKDANNENSI